MRIRGYAPVTPCWAELTSHDPARSIEFYSGLLGWRAREDDSGATIFTLRDLAVAGLHGAGRSAWVPYVTVEDIDATCAQVASAGGEVLEPVTDRGRRGRAARCADIEAATFGLWQPGTFAGAQLASEPGAVCWSEVATWDPPAAAAFYGKVFGWVDQPGQLAGAGPYRDWRVTDRVVAGMLPMLGFFPDHIGAHWRITIEVADCDQTATRCAELGGRVLAGPMDVGIGRYAQLSDPTSGVVGVIAFVPEFRVTW